MGSKGKSVRKASSRQIPENVRKVNREENPDKFYSMHPSWRFSGRDRKHWTFSKERLIDAFWDEIIPFLESLESMTWAGILKYSGNNHHMIDISKLNPVARKAMDENRIEAESIMSLRLQGRHRLYGIMDDNVFCILWFDVEHGDNSDCVCRSRLKHT